jgi:hypothetical protein
MLNRLRKASALRALLLGYGVDNRAISLTACRRRKAPGVPGSLSRCGLSCPRCDGTGVSAWRDEASAPGLARPRAMPPGSSLTPLALASESGKPSPGRPAVGPASSRAVASGPHRAAAWRRAAREPARPSGHTERVTDLENPRGRDMTVAAIGATFAAILAIGTGPLAPVVAAAATPLTTRMAELAAAEWRRKSHVVAESALEASGLASEAFCEALAGDPDMIALTQKVLWAASVSGSEQKLRGLGDLLGRVAANPGDRLDETQVLVAALADLEGPTCSSWRSSRDQPQTSGQRGRRLDGCPTTSRQESTWTRSSSLPA